MRISAMLAAATFAAFAGAAAWDSVEYMRHWGSPPIPHGRRPSGAASAKRAARKRRNIRARASKRGDA